MAKINNVELKSLKTFPGHDSETCYFGNIYLNGKMLGTWSEDAWSGPDKFGFDESLLDEACSNFRDGFPDSYPYKKVCDCKEVFISRVKRLKLLETDIRKTFKKDCVAVVLATDGFSYSWFGVREDIPDDELYRKYGSYIVDLKKSLSPEDKDTKVHIFRSNTLDFTIDRDHPAPDFMMF